MLEEQVLNAKLHDRAAFRCGVPALDDYLHKYAVQQNAKGLRAVFVLVDPAQPRTILGFYTLSAGQVDVLQLSDAKRKKLPRYPLPCFRMGRLARHIDHSGKGLREILIGCAVDRCLQARNLVGAYALLVDAKSKQAKLFYEHYGFKACVDAPMTLHLPLGAARRKIVAPTLRRCAGRCPPPTRRLAAPSCARQSTPAQPARQPPPPGRSETIRPTALV